MKYISIKTDKAYRLINSGACIFVVSKYKEKTNLMSVSWKTPVNYGDSSYIAICISNQSFTYSQINKTNKFTISVPPIKYLKELKNVGSISGSAIDKFEKFGLKKRHIKNFEVPSVDESIGNIYCQAVKKMKFDDVDIIIGKVIYSEILKDYFKDGIIDISKVKTIHHLGSDFFTIPDKLIHIKKSIS